MDFSVEELACNSKGVLNDQKYLGSCKKLISKYYFAMEGSTTFTSEKARLHITFCSGGVMGVLLIGMVSMLFNGL